jgi:5-methylcytosine-specific restriction endonuclease McrA
VLGQACARTGGRGCAPALPVGLYYRKHASNFFQQRALHNIAGRQNNALHERRIYGIYAAMPKRGEIRDDGLIYWDQSHGAQRWITKDSFAIWSESRGKNRKAWHQNNIARNADRQREWERKNAHVRATIGGRRRKSLKVHGFRVTADEIRKLSMDSGGVCRYCGCSSKLQIEHVIPVSRGGPHHISNLAMACKACNSSKSSAWPEDFLLRKTK